MHLIVEINFKMHLDIYNEYFISQILNAVSVFAT